TTIMAPTASNAATATSATTTNNARLVNDGRAPTLAAKSASKVPITSSRQRSTRNATTTSSTQPRRGNCGGSHASACGSSHEDQSCASSHSRLSRLPYSTCSTSRCTELLFDCSSNSTPAANRAVNTTPMAAPGSTLPRKRISSISATARTAEIIAPSSMGTVSRVLVNTKAPTMPSSTTWLM